MCYDPLRFILCFSDLFTPTPSVAQQTTGVTLTFASGPLASGVWLELGFRSLGTDSSGQASPSSPHLDTNSAFIDWQCHTLTIRHCDTPAVLQQSAPEGTPTRGGYILGTEKDSPISTWLHFWNFGHQRIPEKPRKNLAKT